MVDTPIKPDPLSLPPASSNTSRVNFKPSPRSRDQILYNPLDDYIDVTYNISLGLVDWATVSRLRESNVQDVKVNEGNVEVFASTGEQVTDATYVGDYYNIKSLIFTTFCGHIPQNPMVSAICDGKMKVIQPYGFSLREDLDDLAHKLNYPMAAPMSYVYRIEIWFSGWQVDGTWKRRIDFQVDDKRTASSITYYMCMTTVDARVTPSGTEYDLSFQTVAHLATRPESIVLHQDAVGTIGTSSVSYAKDDTFGSFLTNLGNALYRQVLNDSLGKLHVTYDFVGPTWLMNAPFSEGGKIDVTSGVTYSDSSGSYAFTGKSVDLYTLLNHVTNAIPLLRQLHLREDDPSFLEPGCLWNIRTHIPVMSEPDSVINQDSKYTYQYLIEPVLSYRSRLTEIEDRNRRVEYENQKKRAQKFLDYGMLVRVYDYFFTNNNSEVIEFQFTFKNFYYEAFPYDGLDDTASGLDTSTANTNATTGADERAKLAAKGYKATPPSLVLQANASSLKIDDVLGIPVAPASATNIIDPATVHGPINRSPTNPASQHSGVSARTAQKYSKSKDQYTRFDMINAQMTVRFDPRWLMSPYMAGKDFTPVLEESQQTDGVFCYVHVDRAIFIRANRPNQKNYMNPNFTNDPPSRPPVLGGFYQVITAVNEFDGGRFQQKLNVLKYPHMNYFGAEVSSGSPVFTIDSPVAPQSTTSQDAARVARASSLDPGF